jgi:hypothetical protein
MRLGPVRDPFRACHTSAVSTATEVAVCFYTVPDHLDPAVLAGRGEGVNRALETVEGVRVSTGHTYLKGLRVLQYTHKPTDSNSGTHTLEGVYLTHLKGPVGLVSVPEYGSMARRQVVRNVAKASSSQAHRK